MPPDELGASLLAGPDEAAGAFAGAGSDPPAEDFGCGDALALGVDGFGAGVLGADSFGAETLGAETVGAETEGAFGTDTVGTAARALTAPSATQTIVTAAAKKSFIEMSGTPKRVNARKPKPRA